MTDKEMTMRLLAEEIEARILCSCLPGGEACRATRMDYMAENASFHDDCRYCMRRQLDSEVR